MKELLTKLGYTEEDVTKIENGMQEAKLFLTKEERIEERYTKLKEQKEELETQVKTLGENANTAEELKKQIEELQTVTQENATKNQQNLEKMAIDNAIKVQALKYEAINPSDVITLFNRDNREGIKVSGDFENLDTVKVEGLEETFAEYVKSNPTYFGKNLVKGEDPAKNGVSPQATSARDGFVAKHKEALTQGDTALAIQIKQEASAQGINLI